MLKIASKNLHRQKGQTLIETIVAIFVLVMGIIAAVGLAISSFSATDQTSKQIIATALARQAIEGVKNMRDENWLNGARENCTITDGQPNPQQWCFSNWLNNLREGFYSIDFNPNNNSWSLSPLSPPTTYVLYYDSGSGAYHDYRGSGSTSVFSRKVQLRNYTGAPYDRGNPPRLDVISTVWWYGKNCPQLADPTDLPASCKVILEMRLTNWKNYGGTGRG